MTIITVFSIDSNQAEIELPSGPSKSAYMHVKIKSRRYKTLENISQKRLD